MLQEAPLTCENCGGRMACRYSVPAGPQLRFRVYRCAGCKSYVESVELPCKMYDGGWEAGEVKELVAAARRRHLMFAYRHHKPKTG